jgi:hypothetical protein
MKILFLILVLFLSGCAYPRFQPSGDSGGTTEYYWAKKTCDICHKPCGFFKVINGKKIICANCYEKLYKGK